MTRARDLPARTLVEDVRRFGLASADMVVERYVRLADRVIGSARVAAPAPAPSDPDASAGRGRRGVGGAADGPAQPYAGGLADGAAGLAATWLRLLEATAVLADRASEGDGSTARLELPGAGPGCTVEGSLWVHNTTASAAAVELAATTLAAPGGTAVPADAVELVPVRLDRLAAGSSAEIRVRVHVPRRQGAGHYLGLVLTSAADQPVLLRLEVHADPGSDP